MLEPMKRTRLYEGIVKQLKDLITQGVLKPGDKLPTERELAETLNVSRTAVREALRALEIMGFIYGRPGEGTFVREITIDSIIEPFASIILKERSHILDLLHVRSLLEVETARLAALHATEEDLKAIEEGITIMEEEIQSGNIGLRGDDTFHLAIATASQNQVLLKIMNLIGDMLSSSREATLKIPNQPLKTVRDHREIFEAIKAGDENLAAHYMREHLEKAKQNILMVENITPENKAEV
ncbi:MAG: FadR/GntR family transcriptional regulator [Bacillota bacterium]|uniref:FCD domain-containing protein n=1 Tax=Thermanaerosceptrum fracticalcis TaxID=1712410 RepID=A0A7G6E4E1_THEFR|nr:FadR/GntR family transcriptional regulator [Thermanaerosceptrum fracticalcis]QNB46945.1 FCD domain-containing protein [Thermanaerosceptrum fracticalcis]